MSNQELYDLASDGICQSWIEQAEALGQENGEDRFDRAEAAERFCEAVVEVLAEAAA